MDLITGANLGKNAMLAFRILTSSGKIYLEYVVNKVKEELEKPEYEGGGPEKVGFNEEGVYDAADYRTIYTLVGNTKQRGVGDLFKRGLMAAYMVKILELTPFFFNGGSDPRNVKLQDKVLVGGKGFEWHKNLCHTGLEKPGFSRILFADWSKGCKPNHLLSNIGLQIMISR